jgi:cyclic pyranopterin phosphate synthase
MALADRHGRVATDLRVSLTDRCNLRCTYCMPAEGLDWLPAPGLLTDPEIIRLVDIAVRLLGVREVRFTGGEPLLRRGLVQIVAACAALSPRPQLSLTTNGIGLERLAGPLRAAGLDRVNVSLDTLDDERFERLTHRRRLPDVLAGLRAAAAAGLTPVKINSVLVRGLNDDEAPALLRFALAHGYEARFIEQMPLDAGHTWSRERMVLASEIQAALEREFVLLPDPAERAGAPAETWLIAGPRPESGGSAGPRPESEGPAGPRPESEGPAGHRPESATPADSRPEPGPPVDAAALPRVGIIASVTRPFCGDCDRTRLTADGQVRNCLFSQEETDLRGLLRDGADDVEIARRWQQAMWGKLPGHGIDDPSFLQPVRPMSAIGG